jgi:type VI secretion system secreted protein VgrG
LSNEFVTLEKGVFVGGAYQIGVVGAMNETVGLKAEEVLGAKSVNVGAAFQEFVMGPKFTKSMNSITTSSTADTSITSSASIALQAKAKGVIDIGNELTIKVGSASIVLKSSGDISIKGAKITIQADGALQLNGQPIKEN